jgi:two-component system cell cycle response regulator DivK
VLPAFSGEECLTLVKSEKPDLILMDLSLPGIDGWSVAQKLKGDPETKSIPLVAVTAHTLPGDRKRALESGFDNYISKPINVPTFNETITAALPR